MSNKFFKISPMDILDLKDKEPPVNHVKEREHELYSYLDIGIERFKNNHLIKRDAFVVRLNNFCFEEGLPLNGKVPEKYIDPKERFEEIIAHMNKVNGGKNPLLISVKDDYKPSNPEKINKMLEGVCAKLGINERTLAIDQRDLDLYAESLNEGLDDDKYFDYGEQYRQWLIRNGRIKMVDGKVVILKQDTVDEESTSIDSVDDDEEFDPNTLVDE